ncbi:MAG: hypothetical protein GY940_18950, partial [bacterium]|nr:hypothetical protein [bacterium]
HPPDKIKGLVLSDHFRRIATSPLKEANHFAESVHPVQYFEKLKPLVERNTNYREVLKRTGLPDYMKAFYKNYPQGNVSRIPVLSNFSRFARHDAMIESVSDYIFENVNHDLFATYFRFPDIIQHFVTHLMDLEFKHKLIEAFKTGTVTKPMLAEAVEMVSLIMAPAYQYMERIIKKYIQNKANDNTYFFIMSDHGFSFCPEGFNHYGLPDEYESPPG